MHHRSLYFCVIISVLSIIDVLCQDIGCVSSDSLLEGRRRIASAVLRASNTRSGYPVSQARLNDNGWCSGQLATNIFDPYIEIDFGRDVLFTSVATQGVPPNSLEILMFDTTSRFIERYRVEIAGEDGHFRYITPSANSSQPAIFPLRQSRISNANRHTESLPRPVIGQMLRISPYEWNNDDYACKKLEVYGCPLQECQSEESRLHNNPGVTSVTVSDSSIDYSYLFNFDDTERYYCGPTNTRPFNMTISYSSPVLLREIGIHGHNRTFQSDEYVNSFSLSFSKDRDNFTEYIRDTGSTEFTVSDEERHYFTLWPPITASSIKITINDWNSQPCMSLLMLGCNYSDVVNHNINGIVIGTDSGLVAEVTLTTTEFMTTTTELVIVTATVTQTSMITVTADLNYTPSPSPTQSSGAVGSTSSDTDNTPIYIAVAIVIVGLLITIIVTIVGVILCRRYWQEKQSDGSLTIKYNNENRTEPSLVDAKRNLHAGKVLDEKLKSESGLSKGVKSKQVVSTSVPASAHKNQRLEIVNLQYESVGDRRHTITDHDYVISSPTQDYDEITTKNDPAIVDNPAYSASGAPPLVDNPAYIAMKGGPGTTTYSNN